MQKGKNKLKENGKENERPQTGKKLKDVTMKEGGMAVGKEN